MNGNDKILALCESFRDIVLAVRAELDKDEYSTTLIHNTLQHMSVLMTKEPVFRKLAADINFRLAQINVIAAEYGFTNLEVYERYVAIVTVTLRGLDKISTGCKSKHNGSYNTNFASPSASWVPTTYGFGCIYKDLLSDNIVLTIKKPARHPAMAEADRLKDGGEPVQIVSTVKDNRQPFITPAELDQAVISALHDKVSKLERENAELREWKNRTLRILNQ